MRLEQILYFIQIVEANSITSASNKLFLTQQALSISLKNLETELGAKLIERTHNGIVLTKEGTYFLEKAKAVEAIIKDINGHFHPQQMSLAPKTINIVTNAGINHTLLPKTVSYFLASHADITLNISILQNEEIVHRVKDNGADLGLLNVLEIDHQIQLNTEPTLTLYSFLSTKFAVCVSRASALAKYKSLSVSTLLQYPVIIYPNRDPKNYLIYQLLSYYGHKNVQIVDNLPLFKQLITDNLGCTLVPEHYPTNNSRPEDCVVIPLKNNVRMHSCYLMSNQQLLSTNAELFVDKLIEFIPSNYSISRQRLF